ncbi:nuclear transport factor 2 family protein [Devosia sp. CAU 1758]
MTKIDLAKLPAPLPDYFDAEDHRATAPLFADNAIVRDEGETHRGRVEIGAWLDRVEARYQPRYHVRAAEMDGNQIVVSVEVSGTFPGSPVVLRQAFILNGDAQIERLETL